MAILHRFVLDGARLACAALVALSLSACASAGRLAEYDFRGRSLAVVSSVPPHPEVVIEDLPDPRERSWWQALIRAGSEVVRDQQAERVGEKLEAAKQTVDVSGLMADDVLARAARLLRATPVASVEEADFEIEVQVGSYGIKASTWDSNADFFIRAEVLLLDSQTGRRIWQEEVDASDPIDVSRWGAGGPLGNLLTARALADLSVSEVERALRGLAAYSAGKLAEKLEAGMERAGLR
jgi:hypothetical protein